MFTEDTLRAALDLLGSLLEQQGNPCEIVVIGGGNLLLQHLIDRPTQDLDALALFDHGVLQVARPLPNVLRQAADDVAGTLGLQQGWLNGGPADQLKQGLPDGFVERLSRLVFGGLTVHLASRRDLVCLKLYAAADSGPNSKHVADLVQLAPSDEEVHWSSAWVKSWDQGPEFATFVDAVIAHLKARRGRS